MIVCQRIIAIRWHTLAPLFPLVSGGKVGYMDTVKFKANLASVRSLGLSRSIARLAERQAGELTAAWRGGGEAWESPTEECYSSIKSSIELDMERAAIYIAAHDIGDCGPQDCHREEAVAGMMSC